MSSSHHLEKSLNFFYDSLCHPCLRNEMCMWSDMERNLSACEYCVVKSLQSSEDVKCNLYTVQCTSKANCTSHYTPARMGNHKLLNDTSLRLCQSVCALRARSMTRLDLFAAGMCSPQTSSHRATNTCRNTVFVSCFEWASRTRAMRLCLRASQNQY